MLDEHAHGYYLHGKVPWSSSDIPLDWLQKELQDEAKGRPGRDGRGLKHARKQGPSDYEVQTFQIYIPDRMRKQLNEINNQVYHIDEEVIQNQNKLERRKSRIAKKKADDEQQNSPKEDNPLYQRQETSGPSGNMSL